MEKLRSWLSETRTSQAELARQLSVTEGALSQWLSGLTGPSVKNLVKLSHVTGLSVDDLVRDRESTIN